MSNITTEIQIDGNSSSGSGSSTNASFKIHHDLSSGPTTGGGGGSASEDDNVSNNGSSGSSQKVISPATLAGKTCVSMMTGSQPQPRPQPSLSGGTCSNRETSPASSTTTILAGSVNSQPPKPNRSSPTLISIRRQCRRRLSSSLSAEECKSDSEQHPVDEGSNPCGVNAASSNEDLKNSILWRTRNKVVNAFK